ncbi:MAG TPA: HAMP domain-containing sensor histidine kinase [Polyangiaceae bacterium]|nr:HAMP domain-containing sensor histidine kinase [Polyangiaceae bacterium]
MPAPSAPTKDASTRILVVVFTVVMGSFVLTTLAVQRASREVDTLSDRIVSSSAPSIEHLAALRGSTLEVELALSHYIHQAPDARSKLNLALDRALKRLADEVHAYLALTDLPGEEQYENTVQQSWARFDEAVRRTREQADTGNSSDAFQRFTRVVEPSASRLLDFSVRAIEFDAQYGRTLAARIKEIRRRTLWLANGLSAFCVALGVAGALFIDRQARSRRAAALAYSKFQEARAAELEQFSGRVAHDIRGPLSAAKLGAELIAAGAPEERNQEYAERVVRSLARADAITSALLEFARSGARPDPGARTDPREVLADLEPAVLQEAQRTQISVRFEAAPPVFVACSVGVYLSLVGNLMRNAIKYMGDAATRRIHVRVTERGAVVRTEVTDTGPGVAEADLESLFQPYFRAPGNTVREGLGLGLATVKKLAEGHGGRAGASSEVGRGSIFWFELPRAGHAWEGSTNGESLERRVETHH